MVFVVGVDHRLADSPSVEVRPDQSSVDQGSQVGHEVDGGATAHIPDEARGKRQGGLPTAVFPISVPAGEARLKLWAHDYDSFCPYGVLRMADQGKECSGRKAGEDQPGRR